MSDLVSVTCLSLEVLGTFRRDYFQYLASGQSLKNKNCHNSRISNDTDMKLTQH